MKNVIIPVCFFLLNSLQGQSIDTEFGTNGVTALPIQNYYCYNAFDIKILDNDKMIIPVVKDFCAFGEYFGESISTFYDIYKLNQEGSLDLTFGYNGSVWFPFNVDSYGSLHLNDLKVQADGKILVCGDASNYYESIGYVVRYKQNGELDFNIQMRYDSIENEMYHFYPQCIGLQSAGKTVIMASAYRYSDQQTLSCLMRFKANGTIDEGFGENGYILYEAYDFYHSKMAVQSDGKIVMILYNQGIKRFHPDGSLDTGFGEDGSGNNFSLLPPGFSSFKDLFIQADGKIIGINNNYIFRFNANGEPDTTFNNTGYFNNFTGSIRDVVESDEKYLLSISNPNDNDYIYKLTNAGIVDSTFGNNGKFVNDLFQYTPIGVQSDGKIIATDNGNIFRIDQSLVPTADLPQNITEISIFPNPFSTTATLSFYSPQADDMTLRIFDLYGKLLREYPSLPVSNGQNHFKIEKAGLAAGMYLLHMSNGAASHSLKIVIE